MSTTLLPLLAATSTLACTPGLAPQDEADLDPSRWPVPALRRSEDPALEARIDALLDQMTLEQKVGQLIQADTGAITPEELRRYPLGAILSGGNSAPGNDVRTDPGRWLALADAYHAAAMSRDDGTVPIPILWGTDAVHGHNNVVGGTVFPHNIGLGAARSPSLVRRIGEVTALEVVVTGQDWIFAPTVAVARDDRWGRTYESYSEDPGLVRANAGALVRGVQGVLGDSQRLRRGRTLATAKHFLGDGGTVDGTDQGNARVSEAQLARVHGAGYLAAIEAGVEVVMASFSSWQGCKVHGSEYLLSTVLKDRWGFDGFVVGDWNGHGQVPGCDRSECPQAIMAGLDMFMVPDDWEALYRNTLRNVREGEITQARLHDAVRRILRVKLRAGLFERPTPSARRFAGAVELLGHPAHRALAREAVRRSAVLLKNNGGVLPIDPSVHVLVLGAAADDMQMQTGGWTLSWQGTGNAREHFPNGQTLWEGIAEAVARAGGRAQLSRDGDYEGKPDVAIAVYGEAPYAEFVGDRRDLAFDDTEGMAAQLQALRAAGIPTVSVFLSGRPLWVNPQLNASDAFVAAWLPGSEGGGIADLLLQTPRPGAHYHVDFSGRLSFSWPANPDGHPLNADEAPYAPLFALNYGLRLADQATVGVLAVRGTGDRERSDASRKFLVRGAPVTPWALMLRDQGGTRLALGHRVHSATRGLAMRRRDYRSQEDAVELTWTRALRAPASAELLGATVDLRAAAQEGLSLRIELDPITSPAHDATLGLGCESTCGRVLPLRQLLAEAPGGGWRTLAIPLECFALADGEGDQVISPLILSASSPMQLALHDVRLVRSAQTMPCPVP